MAYSVFGNPITDQTLKGMPEYVDKPITRLDRARVAFNMKNAANKDANAREYVEKLKAQWGNGVSTLCVVYNATGDRVKFETSNDYHGHIGPAPYPVLIENGQWGAFLHVKTSGTATGSTAAIVYRGKNQAGNACDWMLAWFVSWNTNSGNGVYTEIREAGHYIDNRWDYISDLLYNSGHNRTDEWNECASYVSIGEYTSPIFEGIMTLKDV